MLEEGSDRSVSLDDSTSMQEAYRIADSDSDEEEMSPNGNPPTSSHFEELEQVISISRNEWSSC